jgi:hypothetical protein
MFLRNEKRYAPEDGPVSIRAVLTRKHYNLLINGRATLEIPEGVFMGNKAGSKVLLFDCEDRDIAEVLCDALDVSGIAWDETA